MAEFHSMLVQPPVLKERHGITFEGFDYVCPQRNAARTGVICWVTCSFVGCYTHDCHFYENPFGGPLNWLL